jgi:hypothetical protein
MKPDIALTKHLLAILHRIGPAGVEEQALMVELEVAAGRPLTTQAAQDVIVWCNDQGWTGSRRDSFRQTRIWITEAGKTILAGL